MAKARIGIIGTGWWATLAHLPSLTTYDKAELIGVANDEICQSEQAETINAGRTRILGSSRAARDKSRTA